MANVIIRFGIALGGFIVGVATCGFIGCKHPEVMERIGKKGNGEEAAE